MGKAAGPGAESLILSIRDVLDLAGDNGDAIPIFEEPSVSKNNF